MGNHRNVLSGPGPTDWIHERLGHLGDTGFVILRLYGTDGSSRFGIRQWRWCWTWQEFPALDDVLISGVPDLPHLPRYVST